VLRRLSKHCDLADVEGVKAYLATLDWSLGTKEIASNVLNSFYKLQGVPFSKPRYRRVDKLPFLPNEGEIDQLIGGCSRRVGSFLQFLKETGARAGEAWAVKWTDLDLEQRTVRITPEKNSNPRQLQLSPRLVGILGTLPRDSLKVWRDGTLNHFGRLFQKSRKRIAAKLGNPRIQAIHFHTLRHWKGSTEYHKTKDLVYVSRLLGHKNIGNTLKYIQLQVSDDDSFICKAAKSLPEVAELVESGFDYVCKLEDGTQIFRKRK
jgi:integrase